MQRQLGVDSETYGYWTLLPAAALMLGGACWPIACAST